MIFMRVLKTIEYNNMTVQGIVTSINAPRAPTKLRRAAVVRVAASIDDWLCTFILGEYSQASDFPAVLY